MTWPDSLGVGLKEWAVVCDALARGRQMVLLRKGGIYEAAGEFEVEHPEFLLFPTYLHQKPEMVKEQDRAGVESRSAEPERIKLGLAGVVTDIVQLSGRSQIEAIDAEHLWTAPLIDMRFNYRPENPLYLMLVRAYRLADPTTVDNTPAYAGCKSWVPLGRDIPTTNSTPILDDATYESRRRSILSRLESSL